MAAAAKVPAGMGLLLKTMGVDVSIFDQVANSVKAVAASLARIEQQNEEILRLLRKDGAKDGN